MKFGICCGYERAVEVKAAGYDYIELALTSVFNMSDLQFKEMKAKLFDCGIKAECYNCFFPDGISLVGETPTEMSRIREYTEICFGRTAELGGEIAVLGSGKARNIPDGFGRKNALEQFAEVLSVCGEVAAKNGMKIAVEPLNKSETNLLNTVYEGIEFVRKINNPAIGCLADFYHIYMENENLSLIKGVSSELIHVHLARPNVNRRMPLKRDEVALNGFAEWLKSAQYNRRLSLEGVFTDDFEKEINDVRQLLNIFNEVK